MPGLETQEHPPSSAVWLLMIEAVNFDVALFDVDDLSAIRGGGEAMLAAPAYLFQGMTQELAGTAVIEPVFCAASQGLARIRATAGALERATITAPLERLLARFDPHAAESARARFCATGEVALDPLLPHLIAQLRFTYALEPDAAPVADRIEALAKALRRGQFERLTVDIPPALAFLGSDGDAPDRQRPCVHDGGRPRNLRQAMPDARETQSLEDLSFSMGLRRAAGRTGRRHAFYRRVCGEPLDAFGFSHDFGELVEAPPEGVPEQIAGKMAAIYLDANGVSALRRACVRDVDDAKRFANALLGLRADLLRDLLHWASAEPALLLADPVRKRIDGAVRETPVLRLETLLWGADETLFVCPAWALEPLLGKLAELLSADRWRLSMHGETHRIHHAVGVLLCSHKAPVRLVKQMAKDLAENAKEAGREHGRWQYRVTGGLDLPTRSVEAERAALFRVAEGALQRAAFSLPLDSVGEGFALMRRFKGEAGNRDLGVPRGKLAALFQRATAAARTNQPLDVRAALEREIVKGAYRDAAGAPLSAGDLLDHPFFAAATAADARVPLAHLLELWLFLGLDLQASGAPPLPVEVAA